MWKHQPRGGRPARICAGCPAGSSRPGPPLYRQIRGSVHNGGMPRSLLPLAPTTPAGGAHPCWDSRLNGGNRTCWWVSAPQGRVAQSKASRGDGRLWRLWSRLIKTNQTVEHSYLDVQHARVSVPPGWSSSPVSVLIFSGSSLPPLSIWANTSTAQRQHIKHTINRFEPDVVFSTRHIPPALLTLLLFSLSTELSSLFLLRRSRPQGAPFPFCSSFIEGALSWLLEIRWKQWWKPWA